MYGTYKSVSNGPQKKNSTFSLNEKYIIDCDMTYAVHQIGGRWKLLILDKLKGRKLRFGMIHKEFEHISERMLSLQLRAMEQDGLIKRTVYAEVPPRVEYELTEMAAELEPILELLSSWSRKYRRE